MANITYEIDFAAQIARLQKSVEEGAKSVQKMAGDMEAAGQLASRALGAVGIALSAHSFASMIVGTNETIAGFTRLSEIAGTTAARISSFEAPARLAGISLDSVATSVARLGKSIGEARLGDVSKAGVLTALGISPQDGRDAAEVMVDVARALTGMKDQTVAGKIANELLGKSFTELRPFLKEITEAGGLHATVTDKQSEASKRLADNITLIGHEAEKSKRSLIESFVPALNSAAEAFLRWQKGPGMLGAMMGPGTGNPGGGINFGAVSGSQAQVRASDNALLGAPEGATGGKPTSAAEAAILRLMKFEKEYPALLAQAQGLANLEVEGFKTRNALIDEAHKQGLLSDSNYIREVAANEDARMVVLIEALKKEEALHKRKGELGKEKEAQQKIQLLDAQRESNRVISEVRVTSLEEVREQNFQRELAQRVAHIQLENTSELDLLKGKFTERQNVIDMAAQAELITNDQWGALSAQNYAAFEKAKTDIATRESEARLNTIQSGLGQAAGLMQSHSRAMFAVGKAAAISQTIMDTYRGAQGAIAALSGIYLIGPALATAAAAGIITAGMARVQQIRSTPFGGGSVSDGASPTFSANPITGVPTAPLSPPISQGASLGGGKASVEVNVTVINQGGVMIGDDGIKQLVRDQVLPVISDAMNNDSVVLFNQNSRQAQNIVAAV